MKKILCSSVLFLSLVTPALAASPSTLPPLYVPPVVVCTLTATPNTNVTLGSNVTLKWTTTNASSTSWSGNTGFTSPALSGVAVVPANQFLNMYFITAIGKYGLGVAICSAIVQTKLPAPVLPTFPFTL